MTFHPDTAVFTSLANFLTSTRVTDEACCSKLVHCINPFSSEPDSEHFRAQHVTLASMARARSFSKIVCPELKVEFAQVTDGDDFSSSLIEFEHSHVLSRSVLDMFPFEVKRPLPLLMDILTPVAVKPDEVIVFTNVDIAVTPSFYSFIRALFSRGVDCAVINRRTISGNYSSEDDLALMECEVGMPHPGFDCFAFRGNLREKLFAYNSCVGIGGVMLPLLYQLLAFAEAPLVLLDAHATFHLGDDKSWLNNKLADYTEHNKGEIDRTFLKLIGNDENRKRLLTRLVGAHRPWVYPERLQALANQVDLP